MTTKYHHEALLDALAQAYTAAEKPQIAATSIEHIFSVLKAEHCWTKHPPEQRPACKYLHSIGNSSALWRAFMPLVPKLAWYSRTGDDTFQDHHANAIIFATDNHNPMVGQTVGATILAPGTGYPDHHHVPEETYLVATAGWFKNDAQDWQHRSSGQTWYNPAHINHAMQANPNTALVAFWALNN